MNIDISKLSKEITDKYSIVQNTFFAVPKDDLKDLVELEVGDSKQPDFYPQVKVCRWGNKDGTNEANVSYRLINNEVGAEKVSTKDGKIVWSKGNLEAHFYDLVSDEHPEGAFEFDVTLKSKPLTNKVEFSLNDKGVEYFYQPKLTADEIAQGASRPNNVVGSYAIYAKTPKTNWTGGKEYKCGKVGHIFRPKIIDSAGTEVWGDLHIENGILSVNYSSQDFLDSAVYPVRHAAGLTFGYTSGGATAWGYTALRSSISPYYAGNRWGIPAVAPATATVTEIAVYGQTDEVSAVSLTTFVAINQKDSGGSGSHGLIGSGEGTISYPTAKDWRSITGLSIAITNGVTYVINSTANPSGCAVNKQVQFFYDAGTSGLYYEVFTSDVAATEYSAAKESPWTETLGFAGSYTFSIYATYTESGGAVAAPLSNLSLLGAG